MNSRVNTEDLALTPMLPRDDGGPVFAEPWQAQAFAMVLDLANHGVLDWKDWCTILSAEIRQAQADGDPDLGDTYYLHWLSALEKLVTSKTVVSPDDLAAVKADWQEADRRREFGEAPVYVKGAAQAGHRH